MTPLNTGDLLANPDLVRDEAPWCLELDNLEIAILLLCLPWVGGRGQRRADIERRLQDLRGHLPVGTIYFQRIKRAVSKLATTRAMTVTGEGRLRRFTTAPEGLASLILNLTVLRTDPTVDGREFELKRAICAMCHMVATRLTGHDEDLEVDSELEAFFAEVENLEIWGRPVITDELATAAFDVVHLIDIQKRRVTTMLRDAEALGDSTRPVTFVSSAAVAVHHAVESVTHHPETAIAIRRLITIDLPRTECSARAVRYRWYLGSLAELREFYIKDLGLKPLTGIRQLAGLNTVTR